MGIRNIVKVSKKANARLYLLSIEFFENNLYTILTVKR